MLSFRNVRRGFFGFAFMLFLGRTVQLVAQGRLANLPAMLGASASLLLLGVLTWRGGLKPPAAAAPPAVAPGPTGPVAPPKPVAPGSVAPPEPVAPSRFAPAPPAGRPAPPEPPSQFAPAPSPAPAPAFAPAPGTFSAHAGPSLTGNRPAPRELTPLRSTTVASLSERLQPEPGVPQPRQGEGERRWGSPAAPGSATQVLPQRGRGRRRPVLVPAPVPAAPAVEAAAEPVAAEPVAEPVVATPPPVVAVPAPRPATAKVDLTPQPGDPTVGLALLGPARAKLHELEPPLVRSWLTLLDAGQRGEPTPVLKAGQLAVLAAGLEDAAVRRRLLRAVADPLVDAVGLVTQDVPLDGLACAGAPPGRVAAARELLLLVARTTTGTPAQGAAVRAVKWIDRPVQG